MKRVELDGRLHVFPDDATEAEIQGALGGKGAAPKEGWKGDGRGVLGGAIADTLGVSGRPGADTPVRLLTQPKNLTESAIGGAVTAPLLAIPGGAPARAVMGGALGAAKGWARGENPLYEGFVDFAVTAATEALGGKLAGRAGKGAKDLLEREGAFKGAGEAPGKVWEAVKARLPKAKVLVPSLEPSKKIPLAEAMERLGELEGPAYAQARSEIAAHLNTLDKGQVGRKAGDALLDGTTPSRFTPPSTPLERAAKAAMETGMNPAVRGSADAATTAVTPGSTAPLGVTAAIGAGSGLAGLARAAMHGGMP